MADFIAVIRRAVDGLSENTPEMRVKVYDRARSAVVRQLENMKPRPPELMFQRQMDKLDAAIAEVEAEHAEAIAENTGSMADGSVLVSDDAGLAAGAAGIAAPDEPASVQAPDAVRFADAESRVVEAPAEAAVYPAPEAQPVSPPDGAEEQPVHEQASIEVAAPMPGPADSEQAADTVAWPAGHDTRAPSAADEDQIAAVEDEHVSAVPAAEPETVYQPFDVQTSVGAVEPPEFSPEPDDAFHQIEHPEERTAAAPVVSADPVAGVDRQEPLPTMPRVSYDETDVVAGFNDFVQQEINRKVVPPPPGRRGQSQQSDFSWDAPFDDLPEIAKPVSFEKALEAKQREIGAGVAATTKSVAAGPAPTARDELEELLGIERPGEKSAAVASETGDVLPPEVARVVSKLEGKSFKVQKSGIRDRDRSRLLPIALAAAAVFVLVGGAGALWLYKDEVSSLVARIMSSSPAETSDAPADPATETDPTAAAADAADKPKLREASAETEVASLDTKSGVQKFTQRLMPDGTEAETETASLPVDQALPEGKTVAGQTDPGKQVAEATTDTKTDATATAAEQPVVAPLAATQKMFLYEERLGQASPVAVPGTVLWREKNDTENGKPNPSAEAQIDIPERKVKALISFKRNTDASLPASHIIEIVFALPKDFEEGNVDSVQRVAFKQTEQDRGNPLIAVPAKITDDFHMVALNDDAEARKVNIDLMKNRSWIDIPITYRNGRRALITLEKGATGTAVFDKVLAEWDALGPQTRAN